MARLPPNAIRGVALNLWRVPGGYVAECSLREGRGILVCKHSQDHRVVARPVVGPALPQGAFVLEADVLEHCPCRGVVFRYVDPGTVEAEVFENVFDHGDNRRSAVSVVPQGCLPDKH